MAVIEVCAIDSAITVASGSIGFGFNPEMTIVINDALFDGVVAEGDTVIYRVDPEVVLYKGIVRAIDRDLVGETTTVVCIAAENTLEAKAWTPTYTAYNKDILCRDNLLNATIADVIAAEFTNNLTGPQSWFTSIEVPVSVAPLIAGPADTHQVSFLSLIDAVLSIHQHVRWFIEYAPASTALLPVGKLVLVDTLIGRNPHVLQIGGATPVVTACKVREDYSTAAGTYHVYGAGDFVEVEEVLTPAWDKADEQIPKELNNTAPSLSDYTAALANGEQLTTELGWGYDLTSSPEIYVDLTGSEEKLFELKDYTFNARTGVIQWTMFNHYIDKSTGVLYPDAGPNRRLLAAANPDFYGKPLRITFVYAGPDCYRLYSVTEPIANLRLRLALVPDPANPGQTKAKPVEMDTVIEAFKPVNILDPSDPRYVTDPAYQVAKVFVPTESDVTWTERQPNFTPAKGYGQPLGSPEFEEGRKCVRFEDRQLAVIAVGFTDLENPPIAPFYFSWRIKCRYTAWRNLLQTRPGLHGAGIIGRFVFADLMKYTALEAVSNASATALISSGAIASITVVQKGAAYTGPPVVTIIGDGLGATAQANMDGDKVDSITVLTPGSGYSMAFVSIGGSAAILKDDTSALSDKADDVVAYYGTAQWTGSIDVVVAKAVGPTYKVSSLPYGIGDKLTLAGSVEAWLSTAFVGIINGIDIPALDDARAQLSIGTSVPHRNPFEAKPPVFVDAAANGTPVLDVSGLQRRSY